MPQNSQNKHKIIALSALVGLGGLIGGGAGLVANPPEAHAFVMWEGDESTAYKPDAPVLPKEKPANWNEEYVYMPDPVLRAKIAGDYRVQLHPIEGVEGSDKVGFLKKEEMKEATPWRFPLPASLFGDQNPASQGFITDLTGLDEIELPDESDKKDTLHAHLSQLKGVTDFTPLDRLIAKTPQKYKELNLEGVGCTIDMKECPYIASIPELKIQGSLVSKDFSTMTKEEALSQFFTVKNTADIQQGSGKTSPLPEYGRNLSVKFLNVITDDENASFLSKASKKYGYISFVSVKGLKSLENIVNNIDSRKVYGGDINDTSSHVGGCVLILQSLYEVNDYSAINSWLKTPKSWSHALSIGSLMATDDYKGLKRENYLKNSEGAKYNEGLSREDDRVLQGNYTDDSHRPYFSDTDAGTFLPKSLSEINPFTDDDLKSLMSGVPSSTISDFGITGSHITDLSPLKNHGFETLTINNYQIKDVTPLSELSQYFRPGTSEGHQIYKSTTLNLNTPRVETLFDANTLSKRLKPTGVEGAVAIEVYHPEIDVSSIANSPGNVAVKIRNTPNLTVKDLSKYAPFINKKNSSDFFKNKSKLTIMELNYPFIYSKSMGLQPYKLDEYGDPAYQRVIYVNPAIDVEVKGLDKDGNPKTYSKEDIINGLDFMQYYERIPGSPEGFYQIIDSKGEEYDKVLEERKKRLSDDGTATHYSGEARTLSLPLSFFLKNSKGEIYEHLHNGIDKRNISRMSFYGSMGRDTGIISKGEKRILDTTLEPGTEKTVQEGDFGKTTTYYIQSTTGRHVLHTRTTKEPTPDIIHYNPELNSEEVEIPFETETIEDENMFEGTEDITQAGQNGIKIVKKDATGKVVSEEEKKAPVKEIKHVGVRSEKVIVIQPEIKEVSDDSLYEGEESITDQGTPGQKTEVYIKGVLKETITNTEMKPIIKHVGTKPVDTYKEIDIPFTTQNIEDETLPLGETKTVQAGVVGKAKEHYVKGQLYNTETITEPVEEIIHHGTLEVKEESIPFDTEATEDPSMDKGQVQVDVEGVEGLKKVYMSKGKVLREEVVKPAVNKKIRVGQIERKTEAIPYQTKEVKDDTIEKGKSKVIQDGKDGTKEVLRVGDKVVGENILTPATDKIVNVGTLEIKSEDIPFNTQNKEDETLTLGTEKVLQEGKVGKKNIYSAEGKVLREEVVDKPIDKIIAIGTLEIKKTPIPFEIISKDDSNLEKGKVQVEVEGSDGVRVTYISKGKVLKEEVEKEAVNKVIHKGIKEAPKPAPKPESKPSPQTFSTDKPINNTVYKEVVEEAPAPKVLPKTSETGQVGLFSAIGASVAGILAFFGLRRSKNEQE